MVANSIVWGIMGFGGPAFAGLLLAFGGWRLVFIVQLPITAVALALGWSTLPSTRERPARIRTDWLGVGILAALTICSINRRSFLPLRHAPVPPDVGLAHRKAS